MRNMNRLIGTALAAGVFFLAYTAAAVAAQDGSYTEQSYSSKREAAGSSAQSRSSADDILNKRQDALKEENTLTKRSSSGLGRDVEYNRNKKQEVVKEENSRENESSSELNREILAEEDCGCAGEKFRKWWGNLVHRGP